MEQGVVKTCGWARQTTTESWSLYRLRERGCQNRFGKRSSEFGKSSSHETLPVASQFEVVTVLVVATFSLHSSIRALPNLLQCSLSMVW